MQDWNNYRKELMQRLGDLGKLAPDTMKGVVELGATAVYSACTLDAISQLRN